MANYDKQFNVNKGLSVNGISVIDNNRNVAANALTVTSTTLVTNLNAEMVGGKTVSQLGVTNANSVISGSWDFSTAPLFSGGAGGSAPFFVSANSDTVTNLSAARFAGMLPTSFGVIDAARSISGAWTYTTAPYFNTVGEPFTVATTTKVANLNADLLDGANADTGDVVSTIAMRDSSGNLTAKQFSMTIAPSARTTDTVFYSGAANDIYKNTLVGFKTSLGLNLVDNVSINSWTGSANIVTLGAATSLGKITASTFKSNVAGTFTTGTAPFEVASTMMVAGLNAQYINGKQSSEFITTTGTSFFIGTTSISVTQGSNTITLLNGVSVSGTAGSTTGSAGSVVNSLTFADATTWNGSAAKTLTAASVGAVPTSALSGTLTGTTINATTLQQGGTALSSLFMPITPGSITVTSTVHAGNYFKTTGTGASNGFIVGSVAASIFTTSANTTGADAWILTGGALRVKNIASDAYKDLYAYNLYDYSSGSAVKASLVGHTHSEYLPVATPTATTSITAPVFLSSTTSSSGGLKIGSYTIFSVDGPTSTANAIIYTGGYLDVKSTNGSAYQGIRCGSITSNSSISGTTGTFSGLVTATTFKTTTRGASGGLQVYDLVRYSSDLNNNPTIYSGGSSVILRNSGDTAYTSLLCNDVACSSVTATGSISSTGGDGFCNLTATGTPRLVPGNGGVNTLHLLANTQYLANSSWGGPVTVYIGASANPTSGLFIYGGIHYASQAQDLSDIRLKRNIRTIDNEIALTQITEIGNRGVIGYRMKTDPVDAKETIGVSAQVIAEIVPDASATWEMNNDGIEYLTWKPDAITALLIASVAKLNERLTSLENSIAGSI